jgi:hypothetical protein
MELNNSNFITILVKQVWLSVVYSTEKLNNLHIHESKS